MATTSSTVNTEYVEKSKKQVLKERDWIDFFWRQERLAENSVIQKADSVKL